VRGATKKPSNHAHEKGILLVPVVTKRGLKRGVKTRQKRK